MKIGNEKLISEQTVVKKTMPHPSLVVCVSTIAHFFVLLSKER
jgi:hypothetical protein